MNGIRCTIFILFLAITAGCAALLPSGREAVRSPWRSFEDAKASYDRIIPGQTTTSQLKTIGFDLYSTPNMKILNYVDLAIATQSLKREELEGGLRECFVAKNRCRAYEFEPKVTNSSRYGNFWLDLFNFKRKTRESGWSFRAMFIVIDNIVVDKLWGGSPHIEQEREVKNPLGPFQEAGSLLEKAVP